MSCEQNNNILILRLSNRFQLASLILAQLLSQNLTNPRLVELKRESTYIQKNVSAQKENNAVERRKRSEEDVGRRRSSMHVAFAPVERCAIHGWILRIAV